MNANLEPTLYGTLTKLCLPYEVFGTGRMRLLFLPGMALCRKMWYNQISYFAQRCGYSVLVIENRGNGEVLNRRLQTWSTKVMARDIITALNELNWTQSRSIHLCGLSMGGMVSLQLALLIPDRIASLCLTSTCARWQPPDWTFQDLRTLATIGVAASQQKKLESTLRVCFPEEHLNAPDAKHSAYGTNRQR